MVMYSIVLNLNGIFRGIGKTIEWKIYWKKPSLRIRTYAYSTNLICIWSREANVSHFTDLPFVKFWLLKIYFFAPSWMKINLEQSLFQVSLICRPFVKILALEANALNLKCTCCYLDTDLLTATLFVFLQPLISNCFEDLDNNIAFGNKK